MAGEREALRVALGELRGRAEHESGCSLRELERAVRRSGLPGTAGFHGQRASEWAAGSTAGFRVPQSTEPLLAVVAVWLSWTGRPTLDESGAVRRSWLGGAEARQWRQRCEGAAAEGRPARSGGDLSGYLARVVQTYDRLNLDVLGEPGRAGEQPRIGLRQVFEPPLLAWEWPRHRLPARLRGPWEELRGPWEEPGEEEPSEADESRPPEPVLDVLGAEAGRRLVVLGDPGAGKTTLSKYLALALAGGLDELPDGLAPLKGAVPIVVELRRLADPRWSGRTFEEYWEQYNATERMGLPREALEALLAPSGKHPVLLVFDGLDEVFDPVRRAEIARHLAALAQSHPQVRTVVTSRPVGFAEGEFARADFRIGKLRELTRPQVERFVGRWYRAAEAEEPAWQARKLTDAVRDFPSVGELAGNPLLLTILAAIGLGATIPRDRRDVYRHAVEVLAGRWDRDAKHLRLPPHAHPDVAHAVEELDGRMLQELLERIAARVQQGRVGGESDAPLIGATELDALIREFVENLGYAAPIARTVSRAMIERLYERAFLIHPFGAETYGFVHRTFLEYLAARDLSHRYQRRDEPELAAELAQRAADPVWREAVLLFLGMVSRDAPALHARVIAHLLHMHRHAGGAPYWRDEDDSEFLGLAVRALAEAHRIGRARPGPPETSLAAQSDAVVDALTEEELRGLPAEALAVLPDFPRAWPGRERYRRRALPWLARGPRPTRTDHNKVLAALCGDFGEVDLLTRITWNGAAREAFRALGALWRHDPATGELVRTAATDRGTDSAVRTVALRTYIEHFAAEEDARALLMGLLAEGTEDQAVLEVAVDLLVAHRPTDPEVRGFVLAAAGPTADDLLRLRALAVLPLCFPGDAESLRAALTASQGIDFLIGKQAWSTLGAVAPSNRAARDAALTVLTTSSPTNTLAASFLSRCWWDEAEVKVALLDAIRAVPFLAVFFDRSAAAYPEVRTALLDSARESSRAPIVWSAAMGQLALLGHDGSELLRLGMDKAATEEPEMRREALYRLSVHLPDHEEVRCLVGAATADPVPGIRTLALQRLDRFRSGDRAVYLAGTQDEDGEVRAVALRLLAHRHFDEEVRRRVLDALGDQDERVRLVAVEALRRYWAHCPEARTGVLAAVRDADPKVRSAALLALGAHWSDGEDVRQVVLAALADRAHEVATTALVVLVQRWPEREETFAAVLHCVDGPLRIEALRMLALVWPARPESAAAVERAGTPDEVGQLLGLIEAARSRESAG
ncbi:HEAT repeat domain-containing protein [Kitasatospora sp. NPDC088134]|uniref:HEAT repeat domain-containing protein n=1 Tax=Kitasatospora sp. NPDC088134 TaxID=3364071 RepID=UPI0037FF788D